MIEHFAQNVGIYQLLIRQGATKENLLLHVFKNVVLNLYETLLFFKIDYFILYGRKR